jgi:hypothetical protein
LKRVDDPRSNLEKARRHDLVAFAQANGLKEITEAWPADLIRKKLRAQGLTRIVVNAPDLGAMPGAGMGAQAEPDGPVKEIDALDALEAQFVQQQAADKAKPLAAMGINELRAECKRLGIKLGRKDNMVSMKEKIEGHGK